MASIAEILALVNSDPVSARTLRAVLEFVLSRNIETDHLAFDHGNLAGLADDDHTQYQKESEKSQPSGYASLNSDGFVPTGELGSGTPATNDLITGGSAWKTAELILDAVFGSTQGLLLRRGVSAWEAIALGASNALLRSDGSLPNYAALSTVIDDAFGSTRGMILRRGASAWQALAIGSVNNVLKSDGTDPGYASLTALIDAVFGSTQGSILYRDAAQWTALGPGTSGQFLKTQGTGANPAWAAAEGQTFVTVATPQTLASGSATVGTYTDLDITAYVTSGDTAKVAILMCWLYNDTGLAGAVAPDRAILLRKNGSSTDAANMTRHRATAGQQSSVISGSSAMVFVEVDASEIFEYKVVEYSGGGIFGWQIDLVGYLK